MSRKGLAPVQKLYRHARLLLVYQRNAGHRTAAALPRAQNQH